MVVWYYDADSAEDADLTEGDMHLAYTHRGPPECPGIAEVKRRTRDPRSA